MPGGPLRRARLRKEVYEKMIQIRIKKGETVERALKRLKKVLDREGLIKHVRATRYFEQPSEKRRKKSARARARARSIARRAAAAQTI